MRWSVAARPSSSFMLGCKRYCVSARHHSSQLSPRSAHRRGTSRNAFDWCAQCICVYPWRKREAVFSGHASTVHLRTVGRDASASNSAWQEEGCMISLSA